MDSFDCSLGPPPLYSRVLESLLVTMVTSIVIFAASMLGECRDLSPSSTHNTTTTVSLHLPLAALPTLTASVTVILSAKSHTVRTLHHLTSGDLERLQILNIYE